MLHYGRTHVFSFSHEEAVLQTYSKPNITNYHKVERKTRCMYYSRYLSPLPSCGNRRENVLSPSPHHVGIWRPAHSLEPLCSLCSRLFLAFIPSALYDCETCVSSLYWDLRVETLYFLLQLVSRYESSRNTLCEMGKPHATSKGSKRSP